MEFPSSWKIKKLTFLRKLDTESKKGTKKPQGHCEDIGNVKVVRVLFFLRQEKKKNPREMSRLEVKS